MNRPRVVPLTEDRLPATVELCADGLRRLAAGMDPVLDVAPGTAAKVLAETIVRGFLDAEPDRPAWVVTDGAAVLAFAGATVATLTPDDAEDDTGRIVGCMTGSIRQVADDQVQRYLLPARHGYIGLTSVTADARGRGVGRSLLDGLMRWLADRDVATVLLQYATGNPLSSRFWARTGFTPCLQILSRRPRLPGSS